MKPGDAAPRLVGRYAIFDAIASGGMASVHFGRLQGPAGFSRTVAIKRLHESFATDPEFVSMFKDEARLAARIRHPNVVPTLDIVAADDELLLVMEYVAGESLSLLLKRARASQRPTPIPIAVDVMIQALSGLHAAHEAVGEEGEPLCIVHRDVSPQNILVGTDGVARVLDFGVAKAVGRMHQTRAGQVKGKIRYMAPEQLLGKGGVSRAADVHAAANVLWESLTGERLFKGETDAEVMYQILEGRLGPPSRIRPDVPPALDEIVMRGLHPDPSERYATAEAMAAALESAVPAVARRRVAAWVHENAADALQRRKERLSLVESTGTGTRAALSPAQAEAALSSGSVSARPGQEASEIVSSLTPPSVERSARLSAYASALGGWRGKRVVFAGMAAALLAGFLPAILSAPRPASRAAASDQPPPREPIAIIRDVPEPVFAAPPSTGAAAIGGAFADAMAPAPPLPEVPRKRASLPSNSFKPIAPKGASPDRLYRRD
jgi:serine/threonine protein kinase